jgi:pyruvate dehydrogenase E1 component alpha subunit
VGYAIPGLAIDGNDVIAVYEAVKEAVDRARAGMGPTLIECKTYRWRTHFEGEPDTYRPPEEVEAWMQREPIAPYRANLIEQSVLTEAQAAQIEADVLEELAGAVEFARTSPLPEPASALEDLWA